MTSMTNPFGSSLDDQVWKTAAARSQYSVRWAGVYIGHLNGQYTFSISAGVQSSVKLFVDNLFLFETAGNPTSATIILSKGVNAMYDVFIEFQVRLHDCWSFCLRSYALAAFGFVIGLYQLVRCCDL